MKAGVTITRVIVGLLFIFSGLVKANDPLGLSYKMQEFFEVWGLHGFNSWTLPMSVLMNAFEIIAGFALLIGWRIKLFSLLLLLLIIFFTFLTGYTYITGMPKNCGCFGDCLPISSLTSFSKDVALIFLIGFLIWKQKYIKPIFSRKTGFFAMLLITMFSFSFQWYCLTYLPVIDCLPFKKGNSISEKMKIPAGARPDSFAIRFIYTKEGKEYEFSPTELPADLSTYTFVSRKDKLIKKGNAEPAIKGFDLKGVSGADSTKVVLEQPYAVLIFNENFLIPVSKWEKGFTKIYADAKAKNIPVYMITGQPGEVRAKLSGTSFAGLQTFTCDNTTIRTAARTNPCLYILKEGIIEGKWSYHHFGKAGKIIAGLVALPASPPELPAAATDSINQ